MNLRAFHRQRPVVCLALSFGAGVLIGGHMLGQGFLLPLIGLLISFLFCLALFFRCGPLIAGLCFFFLFVGMIRAQLAVNPSLPPEGKYVMSARVEGMAERREEDGRIKAVLRDVHMTDSQGTGYHADAAYWTYYPAKDAPLPLDGQEVEMEATLYHPLARQNPYGFNFRLYLLQRGITVGVSGARELQIAQNGHDDHASPWIRARMWLSKLYEEAVGEGSELIRALLWGDRSGLGDETEQDFKDAGITHVLSVSGLHVSILAGAFLFLLNVLSMPPKWRFIVVVAALAIYCRLLDFAAPVLRSAIMSTVLMAGSLYKERSDPLTSLSIAFILILALRPLDLFHAGFQLSFLAVLSILTLGDSLSNRYNKLWEGKRRRRKLDQTVSGLQATISATAFTIPVMANTFHRISLGGLLFSPIACLFVGVLMIYGLAMMPIAIVWMPLAQFLSVPLSFLSVLFVKLTDAAALLPFSNIMVGSMGTVSMGLCFIALMLCTRYVRAGRWPRRLAGVVLSVLIMTALPVFERRADMSLVRYTLFSSGSADAAVIEDGPKTYVIDCAEHGGDLSSYLLSKGRAIDILFVSHLHRDHIGGLIQLMEQGVNIRQIVLPEGAEKTAVSDDSHKILDMAKNEGIPIYHAALGDSFEGERVKFDVLWPVYGKMYPGLDANHHSMALRVNLDGVTLLTAGDLTQEYEMYSAVPAQVLKLAHHGAKGSTSVDYLCAVSPQLALLTANRARMQYTAAALKRLDALDIPLWGTEDGYAVIIKVMPQEELSIQHYHDRGI